MTDDVSLATGIRHLGSLFEASWRADQPLEALAEHLPPPGDGQRLPVLHELAVRDLELRLAHGISARVEDYLARFPELGIDVAAVLDLIQSEFDFRRNAEPHLALDEFRGRFPELADELPRLLRAPNVPGYEVLELLGRGGMAVVYKARDVNQGRLVALKLVRDAEPDPAVRARFRAEAEAAAQLRHPNIVQTYELGEHAGRPFLVLEYCSAGALAKHLERPWPSERAAKLVETLARAVHYAHQQGIIHRDLKPANILLADDGPKISDFGLAKQLGGTAAALTETGTILGTPHYMAPEQAAGHGRHVTAAADVYALGSMLYELLVGRPPFLGKTREEVLRQVREQQPVPPRWHQPHVGRHLETICLKCLEKDPRRRYESAAALADDLARYVMGQPIRARRPGLAEQAVRWGRQNPTAATRAVVAVIVAVFAAGIVLYQWRQAAASARQTRQLLAELVQLTPVYPLAGYDWVGPSTAQLLRAETLCRNLLAENPADADLRATLTKVYGHLGAYHTRAGQVGEGNRYFRNAVELWEPAQAKDSSEFRQWRATTHFWYAFAAHSQLDFPRAVRSADLAAGVWQDLAERSPSPADLRRALQSYRLFTSLIGSKAGREGCLTALLDSQAELRRQLDPNRGGRALRNRLGLTGLILGDLYRGEGSAGEAAVHWHDAYQHFRQAAEQPGGDLFTQLLLATTCSRLMGSDAADPFYREAVALFERTGQRFAVLLDRDVGDQSIRLALLEAYCSLALCHSKAGRTSQAEQVFRQQVRHLARQFREQGTEVEQGATLPNLLSHVGSVLRDSGQPAAAREFASEAAALALRYAAFPSRDVGYLNLVGGCLLNVSALLNQLYAPEESLRLAEQARELFERSGRTPQDPVASQAGLHDAWTRIGKAQWELGHAAEALAAFRKAAGTQRQIFERDTSNPAQRTALSRCYARLAYWSRRHGDWSGAAAALAEREKLWRDNVTELLHVARAYEDLAGSLIGHPDQERQRRAFVAEGVRLRRAAENGTQR